MIERDFHDIPDGKLEEVEPDGYLAYWGRPKGLIWSELLDSQRVLIFSAAGTGKTYECQAQANRLWDEGKPAFFIELASLARESFRNTLDLDEERRLDSWLTSQTEEAFFFLDSFDELKLSQGSFKQALINLKRVIGSRLHRSKIIVTSRPVPFDEKLVREILPDASAPERKSTNEEFARTAMGESQKENREAKRQPRWRRVVLMPLSNEQVVDFAREQGVSDPEEFSRMLHEHYPPDYARRPLELIELCDDWREQGTLRTHYDQIAASVRTKLLPHEGRVEPAEISPDKALEGARRLALGVQMSRRFTIRHSRVSGSEEGEAALDPAIILSDWQPIEQKALLERPLFSFASYGRVRFHHRSASEFLAAEQLIQLLEEGMSLQMLRLLLFTQVDGKTVVRPSKRPIAGWLALKEQRIFELLRDNEPAVLLNEGDPERLSPTQRKQALRAYCDRYGPGDWRGLKVPLIQVHRFASEDLADVINAVWQQGVENPDVIEVLIDLIGAGQMKACADILFRLACDPEASLDERRQALRALVDLEDERLTAITASVVSEEDKWPDKVKRTVCFHFFPKFMTVGEFCQIIPRLEYNERNADELKWHLPGFISEAQLDLAQLEQLRDGLTALVSEGLSWRARWDVTCKRPYLRGALAAVCLRGLELDQSDEWLNSSFLTLLIHGHNPGSNKVIKALRDKLISMRKVEAARFFWIEDRLLQSLRTPEDPLRRFLDASHHDGVNILVSEHDLEWVCQALGDSSRDRDERAMLLEAAIRLAPNQEEWHEHVAGLRKFVADDTPLLDRITECLKPQEPDEEALRRRAKWDALDKKHEKERSDAADSWRKFCDEVRNHPDDVFSPDREKDTAWWLWHVMRQSVYENRDPDWNRRFLELHFNKETADRFRSILMSMWREESPTRRSERPEGDRGKYKESWLLGLAAIYAETEDPDWGKKLSYDEAVLAARFALVEFDNLPAWIDSLVLAHPKAVEQEIGDELTWELEQVPNDVGYSMLLQHISYTSERVVRLFLPRLRVWLDANTSQVNGEEGEAGMANRIRQVARVILKHGDGAAIEHLFEVACQKIDSGLSNKLRLAWFPSLMRIDPALGMDVLAKEIRGVEPAQYSDAVILLATLFADREDSIDLGNPAFTPDLLLRLVRLAHQHIKREDDIHHQGSFSPDVRDDAQQLRFFLMDALLQAKGEEAWAIKMEMVEDPLFAHYKDRNKANAEENRAQEIDSQVFNETQVIQLIQSRESPVTSNEAMFALLKDRLTDLDELLLSDMSPRENWANINEEKLMRREIARVLHERANAKYLIDQEAVTAEEKETDIRLISTTSDYEGVIELKIGDKKRSAQELRDAIEKQLVDKYLAPQNRRAGIFLFTLANDRGWQHPDDGHRIEVEELEQLLHSEAMRIQKKSKGTVLIDVHFLDLRPRLSSRISN